MTVILSSKDRWWWISFQDFSKPEHKRFAGCVMVRAKNAGHLMQRLTRLALVPKHVLGKDLHISPILIPREKEHLIEQDKTYRLLDYREAYLFAVRIGEGEAPVGSLEELVEFQKKHKVRP
jgi:hypothetical protein